MYTNDMMLKTEEERKSLVMSTQKKSQFSMGENGDCPGFAGLYEFCQLSCGASIDSIMTYSTVSWMRLSPSISPNQLYCN